MLGVVRDITKRKTAQLNLQESEKRLTQAQAIASLGSWAWDIASGRLFWSDEIYRIFGHTPDAFKPTYDSFIASIHPDDLEQVLESEKNALSHGTKHSIDHRIIRPNGSIRWVHEEAEAILNESGQAMTLQGTVQDITDRKYAEQLEKGRSRILEEVVNDKPLNEILTTMILHAEEIQPDMIGSVLMLDDSGQHLLHASAPNLPDFYTQAIDGATIGPDVGSCGAAAFSKKPVIIENIEAHPNWQNCIDLTQKANLKACWSHPILSSSGNILGTFAMYYSEPRAPTEYELNLAAELAKFAAIAIEHTRAQENLIKAREEAIKANLAKSEFLSSMSHELRTPLNAIIGFSQLLKMPDNNFDEHQTKGVEEIHHAGKHLLELINDILDLARIEAGKINLSIENLLIGEVLAECLNLISPLATRHKLDILLTFNNRELGFMEISDLDLQVRADKTRLKQVLINLMSNAAKYNKDNGKISITGELIEDKNLRIAITDTGKGISEEQQKKLFKPFSRLGAEFSNIEGTGIGLVITKNIIESMGGQIGFNSTPGEGSTFWIDIPLATHSVAETNNRFDNNMNTTTNDSDTQYTVLYIEDNPSNVRLVAQLLKHRPNIKLLEAVEPISGIELALNEKPDLILLDINLPTMNGFDVLKELKKHDPTASTPVLAVSANAMAEDIENGEIAGFDEYITKPIDTVAFLKTMDKYLK